MKRWVADRFINPEEQQKLYEAFRAGRDGQAPTEADLDALIIWAARVRRGDFPKNKANLVATEGLLDAILHGMADVCEIRDGEPAVRLNAVGAAYVKKKLIPPEMLEKIEANEHETTPLPKFPREHQL